MAFKDLRQFMAALEQDGQLKRIQAEVDPVFEITEIADRVMKAGGPALLFEKVKGSAFPVAINLFGSARRMSMALGVAELDEIGRRIRDLTDLPSLPGQGLGEKLKAIPKLFELRSVFPRTVRTAPCHEVVVQGEELERFNLSDLPVLHCWPADGGRFITLPLVITEDPETGRRNLGMYRLQVYDGRTTGMHFHPHKDAAAHFRGYGAAAMGGVAGAAAAAPSAVAIASGPGRPVAAPESGRMPVAVALGADPATIYCATAPLPRGIDEFLLAGFLRREPVELVRGVTVDLEVPAAAEFVLEGYVDPGERRVEGPFGDHTGFYSLADEYPVFHLTAITHRRDAIYPATIVGRPPMEDAFIGKATERIFLPLLQMQLPEIVDMHLPVEGVFHNCAVVAIRKAYPGHARKVMHALWGMGQMMYTKVIIVVDHTTDVQNLSEVAWKVFNNIDPRRDIAMVEGPLDALDHASPTPFFGSKMGVDATIKGPLEGHPRPWPAEITMRADIKALVERRWKEYGL